MAGRATAGAGAVAVLSGCCVLGAGLMGPLSAGLGLLLMWLPAPGMFMAGEGKGSAAMLCCVVLSSQVRSSWVMC